MSAKVFSSKKPGRSASQSRGYARILALYQLLEFDPDLLLYLSSAERVTQDPIESAEDLLLIADRLSMSRSVPTQAIAAIAGLEAHSQELEARVLSLEQQKNVTRLGAFGIAISVLIAAIGAVAAFVQILDYLKK